MKRTDGILSRGVELSLIEFSSLFHQRDKGSGILGKVHYFNTGTAALNRVVSTNAEIDGIIPTLDSIIADIGDMPLTWVAGSISTGSALEQLLLSRGFRYLMEWTGMVFSGEQTEDTLDIPGLEICEASHGGALAVWAETAAAGFGMPGAIGRDFPLAYANADRSRLICYLAGYGSRPVATACLHLGSQAGAYFISTLPEYRGGGFSQAITAHLVAEAYKHGYNRVFLQASPAGEPVYRALGFNKVCKMDVYALHF